MRSAFRLTPIVRAAQHHGPSTVPTHHVRQRLTTNLTGVPVHPEPLPTLLHTYKSTLSLLQQMPQSAVYRQSVESITKERMNVVEKFGGAGTEQEIETVESQLAAGCIEEVLVMAEDEFKLAAKMLEWKAWEELVEAPAADQWVQFKQTPSTTTPDDLTK